VSRKSQVKKARSTGHSESKSPPGGWGYKIKSRKVKGESIKAKGESAVSFIHLPYDQI